MASSWERLASGTFSTHTIDSGTFTAKEHLHVEVHFQNTSTVTLMAFNADTTEGNYSSRRSNNGASDGTYTDNPFDWGAYLGQGGAASTGGGFLTCDIINKSDKEKLCFGHFTSSDAGNEAPVRTEFVFKWVNTSAQITRIQLWSGSNSDTWDSGTVINVWGADDQGTTAKDKSTITDVPAGTRYEETDTRKIFRRKNNVTEEFTFNGTDHNDQTDAYDYDVRGQKLEAGHELIGKTLTELTMKFYRNSSNNDGTYYFGLFDSVGNIKHIFGNKELNTIATTSGSSTVSYTGSSLSEWQIPVGFSHSAISNAGLATQTGGLTANAALNMRATTDLGSAGTTNLTNCDSSFVVEFDVSRNSGDLCESKLFGLSSSWKADRGTGGSYDYFPNGSRNFFLNFGNGNSGNSYNGNISFSGRVKNSDGSTTGYANWDDSSNTASTRFPADGTCRFVRITYGAVSGQFKIQIYSTGALRTNGGTADVVDTTTNVFTNSGSTHWANATDLRYIHLTSHDVASNAAWTVANIKIYQNMTTPSGTPTVDIDCVGDGTVSAANRVVAANDLIGVHGSGSSSHRIIIRQTSSSVRDNESGGRVTTVGGSWVAEASGARDIYYIAKYSVTSDKWIEKGSA